MQRLRQLLADLAIVEHLRGQGAVLVIASCWLLDQRWMPKMERLRPLAYGNTFVCLALAGFAALAPRRAPLATRLLALGTAAVAFGPYARAAWLDLPRSWALNAPDPVIYGALVSFLLAVATAVTGKLDAAEFGIGLGDWRWWAPRTGLVVGMVVIFGIVATLAIPALREYYPADLEARKNLSSLFVVQAGRGLYLLAEEFFWHGLALFALARSQGPRAAVVLTSFLYFAAHDSKPEIEMVSSLFGALLLGAACLRARTFWPAFLLHWPLNLAVELTAFIAEGPRAA